MYLIVASLTLKSMSVYDITHSTSQCLWLTSLDNLPSTKRNVGISASKCHRHTSNQTHHDKLPEILDQVATTKQHGLARAQDE